MFSNGHFKFTKSKDNRQQTTDNTRIISLIILTSDSLFSMSCTYTTVHAYLRSRLQTYEIKLNNVFCGSSITYNYWYTYKFYTIYIRMFIWCNISTLQLDSTHKIYYCTSLDTQKTNMPKMNNTRRKEANGTNNGN